VTRLIRPSALWLLCAMTFGGLATAAAADYPVVNLTPNMGDVRVDGPPAISDNGTVYFHALSPKTDPLDHDHSVIYQSRNGVTTPLKEFAFAEFGTVQFPSANASGTVAVAADGWKVNNTVVSPRAIYTISSAGELTRVVDDTGPFKGFGLPRITDAGGVVFEATLDNGTVGIFNGPDPVANRIVDRSGPFGNAQYTYLAPDGSPLFIGTMPGTTNHFAAYKGPDPDADLVLDLGKYRLATDFQQNARGQVLFSGMTAPGSVFTGLYTGPDPVADRLIDDTTPLRPIRGYLNDNGQVAIWGLTDDGVMGLFAGTDPVADKIIAVGDPLFGSTLAWIGNETFAPGAFNNRGELAFRYGLADGTIGFAVVTVPEPASLAVVAIGVLALLRRRPRLTTGRTGW
jgi:hypothetical protein